MKKPSDSVYVHFCCLNLHCIRQKEEQEGLKQKPTVKYTKIIKITMIIIIIIIIIAVFNGPVMDRT